MATREWHPPGCDNSGRHDGRGTTTAMPPPCGRATASAAAVCLAVLLIALFAANARAARHRLTIAGEPATALLLRTLLQIVFIVALIAAGFAESV
jgi:hypothetical protein